MRTGDKRAAQTPALPAAVRVLVRLAAGTSTRTLSDRLSSSGLYTEFPMFVVPKTMVRLGAQPFGTAATYKLAAYATGDFPGVNWVTHFGPAAALNLTYAQVEERLTGKNYQRSKDGPVDREGGPVCCGAFCTRAVQKYESSLEQHSRPSR